MIPLMFYLNVPPVPGLLMGYLDFRMELAAWLGYGTDSTYWEEAFPGATAELHRSVNEAYAWCLYPSTLPSEPVNHVWTHLEREGSIALVADQYEYSVPSDFASFSGDEMWWSNASTSGNLLKRMEIGQIVARRQYYQASTAYPQYFAVTWNPATLGESQTQKIVIHPPAASALTLLYRYAVNAEGLSETNPYPLGGQRMSQLVMEACRALGEYKKNGARGSAWDVFREALDSAIRMDRRTNTATTVGMMRGSGARFYDPYVGESAYYADDGSGTYVQSEAF